jgi:glucokinase
MLGVLVMSLIVADVGGTNARFAVSVQGDSSLRHITHLRCADFDGFEDAFERFLVGLPRDVQSGYHVLSLVVAAPVNHQIVDISNNHWRFEKNKLLDRLGLDKMLVINDFTAQALAQHEATDFDRIQLLDGVEDANAPMLVIGPGTGLGVSALISVEQEPLPVEGEGGNIRFTPQTEPERNLCDYMEQQTDHVVVEHFVSGSGLENIHRFLTHAAGTELSLSAEIIVTNALREEGICRDAANLMIGILGAAMGDHVLTMGCWRGVVITGGIMPRLQPLIVSSPLEQRFRSVGEMSHILGNVPVWLSTDPHAGLKGAQAAFGNPFLVHRLVTG